MFFLHIVCKNTTKIPSTLKSSFLKEKAFKSHSKIIQWVSELFISCTGYLIGLSRESDQDDQNLKKSTFTGRTLKIYSCTGTSQDQKYDLLNIQLNSNYSDLKVHVFKDLTVGYPLSVSWTPHQVEWIANSRPHQVFHSSDSSNISSSARPFRTY